MVGHLISSYRVSVKRACSVCQQSRGGWYQRAKEKPLDTPLKKRMHEIASTRVRYGFWRIYVLIRRDGWQVNHKRIYRLYREEGLNLRSKRPRRRRAAAHRTERPILTMSNQAWSMDFVADALFDGRKFRALTLVDNFSRECLGITVDQSLKGDHVVALLNEVVRRRGRPIRVSRRTTDQNSYLSRWIAGPTRTASRSISPVPASPPTTRSSNRLTAASATSASTRAGSCRSMMRATRSKPGDRTTIISGRIHRSETSRQRCSHAN